MRTCGALQSAGRLSDRFAFADCSFSCWLEDKNIQARTLKGDGFFCHHPDQTQLLSPVFHAPIVSAFFGGFQLATGSGEKVSSRASRSQPSISDLARSFFRELQ